jgi:DNA-binding PadR family transcriptional regulator
LERGQLPPLAVPLPRGEPEPPEGGDPMRLALWLVNWSAYAVRVLLHLRSRSSGKDEWGSVVVAAGGYRYTPNDGSLGPVLLRLKELNLIEWELLSPERSANLPGHPKRIVRLTERGRQVAEAILKLAALLAEESGETFL